jgi:hypothetical protein
MPDYQLGKIYQIVCLTTGEKYIGSTTQQSLALRLAGHCRTFKSWKKGNGNLITSYSIIERGNYQIELLELYPCNSKDELNARECYYIRTIDCINKLITGQTRKEHYDTNKAELLEKKKVNYELNKTDLLDKQKEYYENHKTKRIEYAKAYREANKDKIAEKDKARRTK